MLGWTRAAEVDGLSRDYYVRQLWDWKLSPDLESAWPKGLEAYGTLCGATLARGHARSGDRVAIAAYLGSGKSFDEAVTDFAESYADQKRARLPGARRGRAVRTNRGAARKLGCSATAGRRAERNHGNLREPVQ
jgi:hypothetical protein